MPKRMSIEIVEHSPTDIRVVFTDDGRKTRIRFDDKQVSFEQLGALLSGSTVYACFQEVGHE